MDETVLCSNWWGNWSTFKVSDLRTHSKTINKHFPYGTLVVNLIGAFIIGFLWELFQNVIVSTNIRVFLFMGILGAFTTFSTFSLETVNLIKDKEYITALINILISNLGCIILVFSGFAAARLLLRILK